MEVGFEPTTFHLSDDSSTSELSFQWYHDNNGHIANCYISLTSADVILATVEFTIEIILTLSKDTRTTSTNTKLIESIPWDPHTITDQWCTMEKLTSKNQVVWSPSELRTQRCKVSSDKEVDSAMVRKFIILFHFNISISLDYYELVLICYADAIIICTCIC